jgi:hypothetical protein
MTTRVMLACVWFDELLQITAVAFTTEYNVNCFSFVLCLEACAFPSCFSSAKRSRHHCGLPPWPLSLPLQVHQYTIPFRIFYSERYNILCTNILIKIITDASILTISRFILLDPILMFFILCTVLCSFRLENTIALSLSWWTWLIATGLSLGCAMSCKWVGAFVVAFVGLRVV